MSPTYTDLMIDLETLDTRPTALVLSIGAVLFSPETGAVGPGVEYRLAACDQERRTISENTVRFWLAQSAEAVQAAFGGRTPVDRALADLARFASSAPPARVWANSPAFDLAILGNLYEERGAEKWWAYSMERDYRTLRSLCSTPPVPPLVRHSALADARAQAASVCQWWAELGKLTPRLADGS